MFALIILLFVDLSFNVSYGVHQNNQLDRLKKVSELKEIYSNNKNVIYYLNKTEKEILNKKHPYELFQSFWSSLSFSMNTEKINTTTQNTPHNKLSIVSIALSSCTVLIFLLFASITFPIWSRDYSFKRIREAIAVTVVLFFNYKLNNVYMFTYSSHIPPLLLD